MSQGTRSATARTLCPRRLPSPVLALGGVLLLLWIVPANAGVLDLAWDAPTTNADGTPLTDLGHYRVYVGTAGAPCPGGAYQQVPSPSPAPAVGNAVTTTVPGLVAGATYVAQVTAVDASGNESLCSNQASVEAKADAPGTPAPTGTPINGVPTNLRATCTGNEVTLTWSPVPGVRGYAVRVNDPSNDSSGCLDGWYCTQPQDIFADWLTSPSFKFSAPLGTAYIWWVHSDFGVVWSDAAVGGSFACGG